MPERREKSVLIEHFWVETTLHGERMHCELCGCSELCTVSSACRGGWTWKTAVAPCLSLGMCALLWAMPMGNPDSAKLLQHTWKPQQGGFLLAHSTRGLIWQQTQWANTTVQMADNNSSFVSALTKDSRLNFLMVQWNLRHQKVMVQEPGCSIPLWVWPGCRAPSVMPLTAQRAAGTVALHWVADSMQWTGESKLHCSLAAGRFYWV